MIPPASPNALDPLLAAPTLDAIFRANARRTPEALALLDPPDRHTFTAGVTRRLTYAEVDRAVDRLAARLSELRLLRGTTIAIQLPNTAEAVITLLALWRADLVAAPLPLLWRQAEAAQALHRIDARALIVAGAVAGTDHAEIACRTAAAAFNIRYVCGFGDEVADGMVALGDIFVDSGRDAEICKAAPAADARALSRPRIVTFDVGADGPAPALRADAQLLAGGLAIVLEARIPPGAQILGGMLPSSFAVIAATVVTWLLTGGTLRLHHPFTPAALAAQLIEPAEVAVLPGALLALLAERDLLGESAARRVIGIWRAPEQHAVSRPWSAPTSLTDVLAFGELGFIVRRRQPDGLPAPLIAGPLSVPGGDANGIAVATVSRHARGTLVLSGPMLPSGADAASGDSGYACQVDPLTQVITIGAPPGDLAQVGGYRFAMAALQDILGAADADGVLAALPDLLAGQKLAGAGPDMARLRGTLTALGLNPLVSDAFRGGREREKGAA